MTNFATKAALGFVLGATTLTALAPTADAQRYRRHHNGDRTGTAIVAGIAGIAIGAALASDDRRYRDPRYDYDRRYYRERGYYPTDGYYYRENYRRYNGYQDCETRRVWDPYQQRRVKVRYCY